MTTSIHGSQRPNKEDLWSRVSNSAPWRHTVGRVSNLIRVPINLATGVLQGLKFLGKGAALTVTVPIHKIVNWVRSKNRKYDGCWSPNGVAVDGIMFLAAMRATVRCFYRFLVAPSVNDSKKYGLWNELKQDGEIIIGKHFNQFKLNPNGQEIHVTDAKVRAAWRGFKKTNLF